MEDDEGIASAVRLNLQVARYDCVLFDEGERAAEALSRDHAYDLALQDIMLPGLDGLELFNLLSGMASP